MVQPTACSMICWFFSIWLEAGAEPGGGKLGLGPLQNILKFSII